MCYHMLNIYRIHIVHNKKKDEQIIVEQYYRNIFPDKDTRFFNAFVSRYIHRRYIRIAKRHIYVYAFLKETLLIGLFAIILPDSALHEIYGSLILR